LKKVLFIFLLIVFSSPCISADLSNAYAFPVPYKPSLGHTTITFTNLASECTIRVYSVSGSLAVSLRESDGDGQYVWDVKNVDGAGLVSGVYLYHIKSSDDSKIGQLRIIR